MKRVAGSKNQIDFVDDKHFDKINKAIKHQQLGEGGSLLDCGAGPGYRSKKLMEFNDEYHSFEISGGMVKIFNDEVLP